MLPLGFVTKPWVELVMKRAGTLAGSWMPDRVTSLSATAAEPLAVIRAERPLELGLVEQ